MALGTLAGIMINRPTVTGLAIVQAVVVEGDSTPVGNGVAQRTLAWVVPNRFDISMAATAIGKTGVVEGGLFPTGNDVAT